MRRVQAIPFLLLVFLVGTGQGAEPLPDAQTAADAEPCLEALGITLPLTQDQTTTCVVTYLHVSADRVGVFDPLQGGSGRTAEIPAVPARDPLRLAAEPRDVWLG